MVRDGHWNDDDDDDDDFLVDDDECVRRTSRNSKKCKYLYVLNISVYTKNYPEDTLCVYVFFLLCCCCPSDDDDAVIIPTT